VIFHSTLSEYQTDISTPIVGSFRISLDLQALQPQTPSRIKSTVTKAKREYTLSCI